MSDDIVEQLLQQAKVEAKKYGDAPDIQIEWKAANEITRLRAEVLEQARLLGMSGEREAQLRARVEVLRKELTDIAEYCDELDATVSTISYAARRALARTAEEDKP
jgi:hypothetical protein